MKLADGTVLKAGTEIGDEDLGRCATTPRSTGVRVRSVLTCEADLGVCARCYGRSLATGKDIELGEAVGVIAAQSIGEPGTQLTMRTFHTGGIAGGGDIAGGLPASSSCSRPAARRARPPWPAPPAWSASPRTRARAGHHDRRRRRQRGRLHGPQPPPRGRRRPGGHGRRRPRRGPRDPKELLEIKGVRETQQYLVDEVQKVYRDQGVSIHDKHIELIVRQMTRRVAVQEPGDSDFLPGERVDPKVFRRVNRELVQEGKTPAEGRPELMGITKASLATDSWLSAASFQETTRVLTEAAIESQSDGLLGLKENIIIGKLIPAGTGMADYRRHRHRGPRLRADGVLLVEPTRSRIWPSGWPARPRPATDDTAEVEVRRSPVTTATARSSIPLTGESAG